MRTAREWFLVVLALIAGTSCRCGRPDLGGVELGFRVSGETVDFGRVLEGEQAVRQVTLFSESRAETVVSVGAGAPFSAPSVVSVPAGGSVEVPVTFTAGDGVASGMLSLSANAQSVSVPLQGEGVRALPCVASSPCKQSRFDLDTGKCVETDRAENAQCTPTDLCLENGVCHSGECVGTPRTCDDQNKCTVDSCAQGVGCVYTPITCPTPTQACRVATCDPSAGCGDGPAPDMYACGSVDCVNANVCLSGVCKRIDTPDGTPCAPATPCQGLSRCENKVCVRPDAGELEPDYRLTVPFPPVGDLQTEPVLFAHQGNLFWETCGDGGVDAGCFLASFTGSGFQRFFTPLDAGPETRVALVADGGVVLVGKAGLDVFSAGNGAPLASYPRSTLTPPDAGLVASSTSVGRVAAAVDGTLVSTFDWSLPDGGAAGQSLVRFSADGGREETFGVPGRQSWIAIDSEGNVHLYGAQGERAQLSAVDGGLELRTSFGGGARSLVAAGSRLVVAGRYLTGTDGGFIADLTPADAGVSDPMLSFTLAGADQTMLFDRRCVPEAQTCAPTAQQPHVRVFSSQSGAPLWSMPVDPEPGFSMLEASLGGAGSLITLSEGPADGGTKASVQLLFAGERVYSCPLPGFGRVGGAVFSRGYLYALVERGGVWRLEAYDLQGTPLSTSGWPQRFGLSGQRRATP